MDQKVSVIVPAFNEEKTVGVVLSALLKCKNFLEIICVNDGSTDATKEILNTFIPKVKIIHLETNGGKGAAIAKGMEAARGNIVVFIDADLEKITCDNIGALVRPLINEGFEATVGFSGHIIDVVGQPLGGQRAYFKKALQPLVNDLINSRNYGLETCLNSAFKTKRVKMVNLGDIGHFPKYKKRNGSELLNEVVKWSSDIAHQTGHETKKEVQSIATKTFKKLDKVLKQNVY